jgi:PD-(D/E)XK nuclease superfamily
VVLIKIPQSAPADANGKALMDATSKWWVIAESRRDGGPASPEYALAVINGRVVTAFRIEGWQAAPTGHRWGFTGDVSKELAALYGGLDVTRYFPPGAANPLRYVHCETPAADAKRATTAALDAQRLELVELVRRLNDEPLTHLMLGHRELFHTNLLAWFFRCIPEAADKVFAPLTEDCGVQTDATRGVQREKNNLDLLFRWPGRRPLVIENKVFSLPDEEQLEKYAVKAKAGGESPTFWLLSLTDPSWRDGRKALCSSEWRWIGYKELAERIRSSLAPDDRSYATETMRHYADVVDLLCDLVASVVVTDSNETVSLPSDVQKALRDDRLTSSMGKLRAMTVAQRVRQALNAAGIAETVVESGLSHSLPRIEGFCAIGRAQDAQAGWQLQGGWFQLGIKTPHLGGVSKQERQNRYDFANANKDLFDFRCLDEILGTGGSATLPLPRPDNPLGFNRYDPDFVYRYKKTPGLTVAQLEAAAVAVAQNLRAIQGHLTCQPLRPMKS